MVGSSLILPLLIRVALVAYSEVHDRHSIFKYTDIDFYVISDAAKFVQNGITPFERSTYRYTPFLSYLGLLDSFGGFVPFGKLVFMVCDLLVGYLLMLNDSENSRRSRIIVGATWLLNPIVIGISTRGNAESIVVALVLLTARLLQTKQLVLSGAVYALAIHFKIYPVIFGLSIVVFLFRNARNNFKSFLQSLLTFGISGVAVLTSLTFIFYKIYGYEFLHATYLYHLTRKDHRHNFSVFFPSLYITLDQATSVMGSLASFMPQLAVIIALSFLRQDFSVIWFYQTAVFVTFNKVVTSQYFVWYISLLAAVVERIHLDVRGAMTLAAIWFAGQALWLGNAYLLEMKGQNSFMLLFGSGQVFFWTNVGVLMFLLNRTLKSNVPKLHVEDKKSL